MRNSGCFSLVSTAIIVILSLPVSAAPARAAVDAPPDCSMRPILTQSFGFIGKPDSSGCVNLHFAGTGKDGKGRAGAVVTVLGAQGATLTMRYHVAQTRRIAARAAPSDDVGRNDDALVLAFDVQKYDPKTKAQSRGYGGSVTVNAFGACSTSPKMDCTVNGASFFNHTWEGSLTVDVSALLQRNGKAQIWTFDVSRQYSDGTSSKLVPLERTETGITIVQHPQVEDDFGVSPKETDYTKGLDAVLRSRIAVTYPFTLSRNAGITLAAGLLTPSKSSSSDLAQVGSGATPKPPTGFYGTNAEFFRSQKLSSAANKPVRSVLTQFASDMSIFELDQIVAPDGAVKAVSGDDFSVKNSKRLGAIWYIANRGLNASKDVQSANVTDESATLLMPLSVATAASVTYLTDSRSVFNIDPINGPFGPPISVGHGVFARVPIAAAHTIHGSYASASIASSGNNLTTLLRYGINITRAASDSFLSEVWANSKRATFDRGYDSTQVVAAAGFRSTAAAFNPFAATSNPLHGTGGPFYTVNWSKAHNEGYGEQTQSLGFMQSIWRSAGGVQQFWTEADAAQPILRNVAVTGSWVRSAAALAFITQEAVPYTTFPLNAAKLFDVNHGNIDIQWQTSAASYGAGVGTVNEAQCAFQTQPLPGAPLANTFTCLPPISHGTYDAFASARAGAVQMVAKYGVAERGFGAPIVTGRLERLAGILAPFEQCNYVKIESINRSGFEHFSDTAGSSVDGTLQLATTLSFHSRALAAQIGYHNGRLVDIYGNGTSKSESGFTFALTPIDLNTDCKGSL